MKPPTYYHGGIPGLRVGQYILPPSETGALSLSDMVEILTVGPEVAEETRRVHNRDRVYLTTELDTATIFAGHYPHPDGARRRGGDVYRVEPEGQIEPDPDYHGDDGASIAAPRARITGIVATGITRRRALRIADELQNHREA